MRSLKVQTPLTNDIIKEMRIGTRVLLSGTVYTARDATHEKLAELIGENRQITFELQGSVIYYIGPSPTKPGSVIDASGPTTSYSMDPYTPLLLENGVKGMIGKGSRSMDMIKSLRKNCAVYFGATGGATALLSKSILESELIAFEELGLEALIKLLVRDLFLIVINDCYGKDLYLEGQKQWSLL